MGYAWITHGYRIMKRHRPSAQNWRCSRLGACHPDLDAAESDEVFGLTSFEYRFIPQEQHPAHNVTCCRSEESNCLVFQSAIDAAKWEHA